MVHCRWRALGQALLIYLSIGSCALTAQQNQPGRETFGEMIAFARLASVACGRLAPDAEEFHALALRTLVKPPLTEKRLSPKRRTSSSFEFVSGFASGASATPMKWPKLAFWLRFSENKISWSKTTTEHFGQATGAIDECLLARKDPPSFPNTGPRA